MTGSVRRQLTLYFVLFALALGVLFGAVTLLVFHRVEDRMIARRLEQMLDERPQERPRPTVEFVGPLESAPTAHAARLRGLESGLHEWEGGGRENHALLVLDPKTGERSVALVSFSESGSEARLEIALLIGVAISSLLALLLARALASRIVSPIERLTERLEAGSLDEAVPEDLSSELREDEIGTLARALQRASHELAASAERERLFLREASHELRTPITVIQGVSDLLHESIDADDTLNRQRLERLRRGLRRMNTSVLSLLAMARAEHRLTVTHLPPFPQQLEDLAEEVRSLAQPGVEIHHQLTAQPTSDAAGSMLIVVLSNLARNAAQHTRSGWVRLEVDAERAQVSDSGPGLPPQILEQLRTSGPKPDLGIGLATVQRICKRFGWGLTVECPQDGGTVATVQLTAPAAPSREA